MHGIEIVKKGKSEERFFLEFREKRIWEESLF
jgi:hypothetical protein